MHNESGKPFITITGKHEERSEQHGFVSRQFSRRYILPDDVSVESVKCDLANNGVLTFFAPRKAIVVTNSRAIPFTQVQELVLFALQLDVHEYKPEEIYVS